MYILLMTHIPVKHGNGFQVLTKVRSISVLQDDFDFAFITSPVIVCKVGVKILALKIIFFIC